MSFYTSWHRLYRLGALHQSSSTVPMEDVEERVIRRREERVTQVNRRRELVLQSRNALRQRLERDQQLEEFHRHSSRRFQQGILSSANIVAESVRASTFILNGIFQHQRGEEVNSIDIRDAVIRIPQPEVIIIPRTPSPTAGPINVEDGDEVIDVEDDQNENNSPQSTE